MTYTTEQAALWTRLMAEAEGWTRIKEYPASSIDHHEAGLEGTSPSGSRDDLPNYAHDLNALQRVCVEICKTEEGAYTLENALWRVMEYDKPPYTNCKRVILLCLTAEQLLPIIGGVLEQIKEKVK